MQIKLDPKLDYVPFLKAKRGELTALKETEETILKHIFPIFEIPNTPWDYEEEKQKKEPKQHIQDTLKLISDNFKQTYYLDFSIDLVEDEKVTGNPFALVDLTSISKETIPVITISQGKNFFKEIGAIIDKCQSGCAIKLTYDLQSEEIFQPKIEDINEVLANLKLKISDVDVILDLGSIYTDPESAIYWASRLFISETPEIDSWRNLILSASSFPSSLAPIEKDSMQKMPRKEWLSWLQLYNKSKQIKRMPIYSDYGIAHPILAEVDPRKMNLTAGIRYTIDKEWLVVRGDRIRNKTDYNYGQFKDLCKKLIGASEYYGKEYSYGDQKLFECATDPKASTGNFETWRKVGSNHHFKVVVEQLASLPASG